MKPFPWIPFRPRQTRCGFSLMELLAAISVLTVGFFAVFDLMQVCLQQTHQVEQTRIALTAAQTEIENLRALDFAQLKPQNRGDFLVPLPVFAQLREGKGELTILPRSEHLKEISVTIHWVAGKSGSRKISLSTLIFSSPGGAR